MKQFHKFYFKGKKYLESGHRIMAQLCRFYCVAICQCDIPLETRISENVYFCHNAFGCVINPNTVIGRTGGGKTVIQHSVTIGELDSTEAPVIGNNVFIGARAVVLGNITIGDDAKIGAGAVVLNDVPPGCTVVGVPARIIKRDRDIEEYRK